MTAVMMFFYFWLQGKSKNSDRNNIARKCKVWRLQHIDRSHRNSMFEFLLFVICILYLLFNEFMHIHASYYSKLIHVFEWIYFQMEKAKGYHEKLMKIKKEMHLLHEKSFKLKVWQNREIFQFTFHGPKVDRFFKIWKWAKLIWKIYWY